MKRLWLGLVLVLITSTPVAGVLAAPHHQKQDAALAPGYQKLGFTPPAPGSYHLPGLGVATDAKVLDSKGRAVRLHELMAGKFTIFSFIYTTCSDVNGCPLASYVLAKVQRRVMADDILKDHVRLVSFSFDPTNDTPEVLATYAASFREPGFDWHFVTPRSDKQLAVILADYNQFVIRDYKEDGSLAGSISHMLRVYLIDHRKQIRNIYSVSFLHADTIMNDIRTIVAANASREAKRVP
jgi:cytochrome c peroxidase